MRDPIYDSRMNTAAGAGSTEAIARSVDSEPEDLSSSISSFSSYATASSGELPEEADNFVFYCV
jgi:hypothetical protein